MKQILFLVAILFAGVGYSQNILIRNTYNNPLATDANQIWIGSKEHPYKYVKHDKYTLTINGESQTKRNGDTLTVIDKTIKFIVVDGITYEIVRNTEIKKVETQTWPIWHPQVDTSFYKGIKLSDIPIIGRN